MKKRLPLEPRPAQLERKLAILEHLIAKIREDYAWTHGWANQPGRSGDSLEGKVTAGAVNDEVGQVVTSRDKDSARRALSMVAHDVDDALAILNTARYRLQDLIPQRDPMPTQLGPSFTSRALRRDLLAAQRRREERGEGQAQ